MALNRRNLYSLLKEAIQTIDPVGGVTMTDILKFAKYKGDWDREKLKTAMTKIIKSNLRDDKLKKVGYRYRMNVIVHDENSKLCGTCGAKTMKGKRKGSSKKCIKLVIRKKKRKEGKKRKSGRKHKCGKSRRKKQKSRRKKKSKCKRKGKGRRKSKGKGKKRRLTGTACILSCLKKNNLMKKKKEKKKKSRGSKSKCKSRPAKHETKPRQKPDEGIPEQQQN